MVANDMRGATEQATEGEGASVPFRSHAGVLNLFENRLGGWKFEKKEFLC